MELLTQEGVTLFHLMFWTIIAMMLVLIFALKRIILIQTHMANIDRNIEVMVEKILEEEEEILTKEKLILKNKSNKKKK